MFTCVQEVINDTFVRKGLKKWRLNGALLTFSNKGLVNNHMKTCIDSNTVHTQEASFSLQLSFKNLKWKNFFKVNIIGIAVFCCSYMHSWVCDILVTHKNLHKYLLLSYIARVCCYTSSVSSNVHCCNDFCLTGIVDLWPKRKWSS